MASHVDFHEFCEIHQLGASSQKSRHRPSIPMALFIVMEL